METDARKHLDDLDVTLFLLHKLVTLYQRLDVIQKYTLLQLVVKRIIINREGEFISHELHSPFSYLLTLIAKIEEGWCSESVASGVYVLNRTATVCFGAIHSIQKFLTNC